MHYEVRPVTPRDAPGVAEAHIRGFYQDSHWRLLWGDMPLDSIIEGHKLRLLRALVNGRDFKRHQMVSNTTTGKMVGYARWILLNFDQSVNSNFWLDAQVKETTGDERAVNERM